MKKLAILGVCLLSFSIMAGHKTNNGGGAMVCRQGPVPSAELLEFWEAENLKGMPIKTDDVSVVAALARAQQNLSRYGLSDRLEAGWGTPFEFSIALHNLIEGLSPPDAPPVQPRLRVSVLGEGIALEAPQDALSRFVERGCALEGMALYDDSEETLYLDREIYDALSPTHKAGLLFHEALYRYLRRHFGEDDSVVARNITACVFAESPCAELSPRYGIPESGPLYECSAKGEDGHDEIRFAVFPNPLAQPNEKSLRFQLLSDSPIVRSYFDINFEEFRLEADGQIQARFSSLQAEHTQIQPLNPNAIDAYTRSADSRWNNIGYRYYFSMSVDGNVLAVDAMNLVCKLRR